jgi:hypothetical protein
VDEPYQCIIRDVENQLNFAFIAESGHGLHSHDRALAERVVQFLNRLLPMERTRP